MPKGTLDIKRQIKSITGTKKVTKAMELVSAAKMRRAVASVLASRDYSKTAGEVLSRVVAGVGHMKHKFITPREVKKVGLVLISSNRGLCGGFNTNLVSKSVQALKGEAESTVLTFGRRGRDGIARFGIPVLADFHKEDITKSVTDIWPIAKTVLDAYSKGELDKVVMVYTEFVSAIRQNIVVKQLLPVVPSESVSADGESASATGFSQFVFEPSTSAVLDYLIPRLLEVQIYQAVLESEASEHSARMLAMRNASDAASDMIFDLSLTFNQARQSGITQEIAEISSASAAMSE